MILHRFLFVLLLLQMCFAYACDPVSGPDDNGSALWTITGEISSADPSVETDGDIRLGVVWLRDLRDPLGPPIPGHIDIVAQDIPIEPEFPFTFVLGIYHPPPELALSSKHYWWQSECGSMSGIRTASGYIVVYNDGDGDGELDLAQEGDTEFIDTVLGVSYDTNLHDNYHGEIQLVYVESDEAIECRGMDGMPKTYQPGLNIYFRDGDLTGLQSLDTPIEFELRDDLFTKVVGCSNYVLWEGRYHDTEILPEEVTTNIESGYVCHRDTEFGVYTLRYTYEIGEAEMVGGVCGTIVQDFYGHESFSPLDEPYPENWPEDSSICIEI